jgi:hypothetical protein
MREFSRSPFFCCLVITVGSLNRQRHLCAEDAGEATVSWCHTREGVHQGTSQASIKAPHRQTREEQEREKREGKG